MKARVKIVHIVNQFITFILAKRLLQPISFLLEPKANQAKLDLIKTQVEEQYPKLKLPVANTLDPLTPAELKAAFTALAEQLTRAEASSSQHSRPHDLCQQLKEFQTHLIQSEIKVEELDLSSVDLQLLAAIKLIIGQQNTGHMDRLMEANTKFTNNLNDQDKVRKLSWLSLGIHTAIMANLGGIVDFFKACSTQTAGDNLLDRILRLETIGAKPSLHVPGLSGFTSLFLFTPPLKLADTADLQARLDVLEAQFTSFREESTTTKVHLEECSSKAALVMKSCWYAAVLKVFTGGKLRANPTILPVGHPIVKEAAINISMEGQALAQTCIQDANAFISGLIQWMCCTYEDLQKSNPSSTKENWRYAWKVGAKLGVDKSVIMWGCLHGRQAALEFTQDGFSNHAIVLNKHIWHRFIMQDEMNTHLAALKKEQEELMKELRSLKGQVDKFPKKA
eukprot:jgi/Psemu1/22243/gm1.22243_g